MSVRSAQRSTVYADTSSQKQEDVQLLSIHLQWCMCIVCVVIATYRVVSKDVLANQVRIPTAREHNIAYTRRRYPQSAVAVDCGTLVVIHVTVQCVSCS
jgi:hypothetical protein